MTTPTNSHQKKWRSTNPCENPCTSISEFLTDVVLHPELMIEILLRLPVKALLRFRCVSKSWCSLISSQQFIKSHLSTSKSMADPSVNSQVLFTTIMPSGVIKQLTLYSALYEPSPNVSHSVIPNRDPTEYLIVVGIVNGLVCVIGSDGMFIWNPVLRKSELLPEPYVHHTKSRNVALGFGYNESNDDYKVVLVESVKLSPSDDEPVVVVYSRLTDSWRRIEECKPGLTFDGRGVYANGKIYWTGGSSVHEWRIVSFDMGSEKYGKLQRPDCEVGVSDWELGSSGDQLVVVYAYGCMKTDLWVMDKYGVGVSWSKVVSIAYHNVHPAISYFSRVLYILRNGVVVLSTSSDLVVYHSERKEFRNIELGGDESLDFYVYVESLVSP